jgi:arylsulfatase A-like enzyme
MKFTYFVLSSIVAIPSGYAAGSVVVGVGDAPNPGTQIEAGATNSTKDSLNAEVGQLWGVSNTVERDGLLYFTYSDLAGTTLPSTIQAGTYTFSARIGASSVGSGFSGLNDITAGVNTDQGSVAGFFATLSDDAETAKNNMVTEFNAQSGVTYTQPAEADPTALSFTTWTFTWSIAEDSPVIGTNPYFGVYTKIASSGGNGFWDDSTLSYTSEIVPPPPTIVSFTSDDSYVPANTLVRLSWEVVNASSLTLSGVGDVTGQTWVDVSPTETTTYTLDAINDDGGLVQSQVTVTVGPDRPNILLMLVDDFGSMDTSVPFAYDSYDDSGNELVTAFNNFYHTPNMEMLAAQGMKFSQAYAMPMCSPTRVSLMTGQNSLRHGVTVHLNVYETVDNASFTVKTHRGPNNWRWLGMDGTDITLPQLLKDLGYYTFFVGKDHMSHTQDPTAIGFDVSDSDLYKSTVLTPKANVMLEDAVAAGGPFFGYICYRDVHSGFYYASDVDADDYPDAYNDTHQKFATMVESVDNSLGSVLAKLDELGVAEDTLVIFLGDNGSDSPALSDEGWAKGTAFDDFPMRGKKGSTYEGGMRVPLIVAWAARDSDNTYQQSLPIPAASVEHDMVTVEDIAPTILAMVDSSSPTMDGYDLTPYLRAESGTHRPQKVLRHMPHEHRSDYFTCFREDDWKIIYRYHTNLFELYNLVDDPDESENLAAAQPEKLLAMARAMARELDASWGVYGELWPTHNPTEVAKPDRPLEDDPFVIDFSIDGRDAVDSDEDGLMDALEDLDGDGLVGAAETSSEDWDTDKDNTDDYSELRLNLDPLDASSFFAVQSVSVSEGSMTIQWPSAPGLFFRILASEDLSIPVTDWDIIESNVPAHETLNETTQDFTIGPSQQFFSIELLP